MSNFLFLFSHHTLFLIENSEDNRAGPNVNQDNKYFRLSGHISFPDNRQLDTLNLGILTLRSKAFHYFSLFKNVLPVSRTQSIFHPFSKNLSFGGHSNQACGSKTDLLLKYTRQVIFDNFSFLFTFR